MRNFVQDVRYGFRQLIKSPMFTLVAVITLALGIGANTAIFSVVNAVLLRPLPYNEPEQLVAVAETDTRKVEIRGALSYPNYFDWRKQNTCFENFASYYRNSMALTGLETPVDIPSATVSANLFAVLKANPQLGRWFTEDEENPNGRLAVVISHRLWQKQFGGDPNILSRSIKLNDRLFQVVGVMPAGFQFPIKADPVDLWVTLAVDGMKTEDDDAPMTEQRGAHFFEGIARLKPGVSIEQAQAEMSQIASTLEKQYPEENTYRGIKISPFQEVLVIDYREALLIILGAVGCVLLIGCANVANLLLARATVRHKEIAVRVALGASRWQIIRQLLTESLLLAVAGGVLGLLLAWWGTEALVGLIPEDVPRLAEINIDWRVLAFTFVVSLTTGILFGLVPAWQATKVELTEAMKENTRGTGASRHRSRLRNVLVIAEVAIAVVLLISAGLLLQTFRKLQDVNLGIDTHNVLSAEIDLPVTRYPKPEQAAAFYQQLTERLNSLPGVVKASAITPMPLSGNGYRTSVEFEGREYPQGETPRSHFRVITLGYFDTLKIAQVSGRDFNEHDTDKSLKVVIVNETFVKNYFPDDNPIGKRVKPGVSVSEKEEPWREIIGVVKDVRHSQILGREPDPEIYLPHTQCQFNFMGLAIRTSGEPGAMAKLLQAEVNAIDKDIPLSRVKTLEQYLGVAIAQPRFNAMLLGMFGLLALTLTSIGLYSVIAYSVAQRTQEIGVRMALGAQTGNILRMVLRQGLMLTAIGLGIGIVSAYYLTELLARMLYGVRSTDFLTFLFTSLILTGVALVACLVPARRAAKTDPMVALRYE
ncbi:MAG: ABC transporter permease [Acidobacteriota bacterium]